jgi:hypothetical protein
MGSSTDIMPAIEPAEAQLAFVGTDTPLLPEPVQAFSLVNEAQWVIGHGGYPLFFGQDWSWRVRGARSTKIVNFCFTEGAGCRSVPHYASLRASH